MHIHITKLICLTVVPLSQFTFINLLCYAIDNKNNLWFKNHSQCLHTFQTFLWSVVILNTCASWNLIASRSSNLVQHARSQIIFVFGVFSKNRRDVFENVYCLCIVRALVTGTRSWQALAALLLWLFRKFTVLYR